MHWWGDSVLGHHMNGSGRCRDSFVCLAMGRCAFDHSGMVVIKSGDGAR